MSKLKITEVHKIEFNMKSKKIPKSSESKIKRFKDDFDFFYSVGIPSSAGNMALILSDYNQDYRYKLYKIANELYKKKDYQSSARFYDALFNFASNKYTEKKVLSKAAECYEKTIHQKLKTEGKSDYINKLYFRLGMVYEHLKQYDKALDCFIHVEHTLSILNLIPKMLKDKRYKKRRRKLKKMLKEYKKKSQMNQDIGYKGYNTDYAAIIKKLGKIKKC